MDAKIPDECETNNETETNDESSAATVVKEEKPEENADSEKEKQLLELAETQKKQIDEYLLRIKQLEDSNLNVQDTCKELESKLENAIESREKAIKEKEMMVMRYATSESNVLKQQTAKESAEKKVKELNKELALVQSKLSSMSSEKARICQLLDNKCYELKTSQQEVTRSKTDLNSLETKLKWSQNSLKNEIELKKEAENKAESLSSQIQEALDSAEKAKKEAQDAIKDFYTSQENRAYVLEQQLQEHQAQLILLRHEKDDKDAQVKNLQLELKKLQKKQADMIQENNKLSVKVQQLETERSEMENRISELRNCADQQRQDAADLFAKTTQVEQLKLQLKHVEDELKMANEQIDLLKVRNADLISDMESCRAHEAELLSFTHQLTDKNVSLQSEFTNLETKVQQLTCEQTVLKRAAKEHETKASFLSEQLQSVQNKYTNEVAKLTQDLQRLTKENADLCQQVADQKGENLVIKRKLELSIKEVTKELSQCRKKLEQYESQSTASSSSSSTSLNEKLPNGSISTDSEQVKVIQPEFELDRHVLIQHIAKLQRTSAEKSEKVDFLEEHVKMLVAELQKKSRLLQNYMKREQDGTLSSNKMDSNKAHLARQTGIMATMYGAKVADENLTLEQSLDINRKLYAVLEDALLKNITLKENMDTLGAEIERLQKQHQQHPQN